MRLDKKYIPTLGFFILLSTIIGATLFIEWALEPFGYEVAMDYEQKGHQLAAQGKLKESSKYFLKAAKIEDDNNSTSRRYRCAGSTASNIEDRIRYFKLALKYNPNNKNAKYELSKYKEAK